MNRAAANAPCRCCWSQAVTDSRRRRFAHPSSTVSADAPHRRQIPPAAATTGRRRMPRPKSRTPRVCTPASRRPRRCRRSRNPPVRFVDTRAWASSRRPAADPVRGHVCRAARAGHHPASVFSPGVASTRLPRVVPVETHAYIAARTCRAAEADLVPGRRVGVIGRGDVVHHAVAETQLAGHIAPCRVIQVTLLHLFQQRILFRRADGMEPPAMPDTGFGVQRRKTAAPGFLHLRQARVAVAVGHVIGHLVVDHRRHRNRRSVFRLRHDAVADRGQRQPFVLRKEPRITRHGKPLVDHTSRRLVP